MSAVDALREALADGTIGQAVVPQVLQNAYASILLLNYIRFVTIYSYLLAFERNGRCVTPSIVWRAINDQLIAQVQAVQPTN